MTRLALALLAILTLAGALAWLVAGERTRGVRTGEAARETLDVEREPAALVAASAPASAEPTARSGDAPAVAREPQRTDAASSPVAWLEGRVVLPEGTPPDEAAYVVARAPAASRVEPGRARVESDGRFRVALPADVERGELELEARYLHLTSSLGWRRGSDAFVVLRPVLGGRIEGEVRFPAGHVPLDGARVHLRTPPDRARFAPLAGTAFAFDALPVGGEYQASMQGPAGVGWAPPVHVAPGETRFVRLELHAPVWIAGVVRDDRGLPVRGVYVGAQVREARGSSASDGQTTDARGEFRLAPLAAGEVDVHVTGDGIVELERPLGPLAAGTRLDHLALVVDRGLSISGEVRWPDGKPAKVPVTARLEDSSRVRAAHDAQESVRARAVDDGDGRFEIGGLEPGTYRVEAQAVRLGEERPVVSRITGRERMRAERHVLVAELDVQAGTKGVVLVLAEGPELAGRVVDARGEPMDDFRVVAGPPELGIEDSLLPGRSVRSEPGCEGRFVLRGLTRGTWKVQATALGHAPSEPVLVTLPASAPVELVLHRGARVTGVVLDPAGEPVAGAVVRAGRRDADGSDADEHEDRTDRRGVFRLVDLPPGRHLLRADGDGGAPSAPVTVELAPGATVADVVLRLEPAGRVTGEVVDAEGRPLVGLLVGLESGGARFGDLTDVDGAFAIEDVPAGRGRVGTRTRELELACEVVVRAGETTHVRLAPDGFPVRLRGRVRAGGEPLALAELRASRGDPGDATLSASSVADLEGVYELVLPGAGRYWVAVRSRASGLGWQVPLDVPQVAELVHDLDVPLARISGRVTDAHGSPLERIEVRSEPEQHEHGRHGSASATTDAEGRYALDVPPGRHAVVAHGGVEHAEARWNGLVLAGGEHRDDVDLVLGAGGVLEGRVRRADGAPAAGAELLVPGPRSRALARTDYGGRFRVEGLEPGPLALVAVAAGAASRVQAVTIRAGETGELELELLPATEVRLWVRDAGGTPVGSDLEVVDASGALQVVRSGDRAGDVRLGPLLPGRHLVRARRDVRLAERVVDVNGEERLELELRFE